MKIKNKSKVKNKKIKKPKKDFFGALKGIGRFTSKERKEMWYDKYRE